MKSVVEPRPIESFGNAFTVRSCAWALAAALLVVVAACDGSQSEARAQAEPSEVGASEKLGAQDEPGEAAEERVVLRARHRAGVPLHPAERSRALSGRLPDRTEVRVLRWSEDRGWLEVESGETRGWISARYVGEAGLEPRPDDPWASREACLRALGEGAPRDPARARLASWNLRWFPDGSVGGRSATPTDIEWVACLVAAMRIDALSVQEIVLHSRGRAAIERLIGDLNRLAGGRWRAIFDECPRDGRQHVGWLIDEARAQVLEVRQLDSINALGGCRGNLRPGSAVQLRFGSGLDLWAIAVHLDSGQSPRDHANRRRGIDALVEAVEQLGAQDDDVLVLGDLNTMGCDGCPHPIDARMEIAALDAALAPRMERVRPSVPCTEFYGPRGSLLDHALASRTMRELPPGARAEVHGPCARYDCALPRGVRPPMLDHLSDHCPLVVELDGRDLD